MSEQTKEQTQEVSTETQAVETQATETQQVQTQEPAVDTEQQSAEPVREEVGLVKPKEQEVGELPTLRGEDVDGLVKAAMEGKLTEEQSKQLKDSGMESHFNMIVEGHKAAQAQADQQIFETVGGKEAYSELQEWAVSNLNDAEIEAFNNAVIKSGDIGVAKLAVEGLQARYVAQNGSAPSKVITSGGTVNESNRPFSNPQEYIEATRSREYLTNPEYAAEVEAKRNKSGF